MGAADRESRLHILGLVLSTLAAVLVGCLGQQDPSFCSTQNAPSLLNVDIFQEVLSNHTDIANSLTQAPFVRGADEDSPAYEFIGHGFHLSEKGLSDSIRAASCATNELTMYSSVFFRDSQSAGPLMEFSYANMAASKLPIFGVSMDAHTDEIIVFYRHRGQPHTEAFRTRLHGGRWRRYAVSFSGNLLKLYVNCVEIASRLVPLPDYCANDSPNVMLSVADSAVRQHTGFTTGLYVYLQNIGFQFGRGGIQRQCPIADDTCPSCGQFLSLVERVYDLREEVSALQQRVADLEVNGVLPTTGPTTPNPQEQGRSCLIGDRTVGHNQFHSPESGQVCFCQDGNAKCTAVTPLPCDPETTSTPNTPIDTNQPPTREPEGPDETPTPDQTPVCVVVELNNQRLQQGETGFRYDEIEQMCRTFTCVLRNNRLTTQTGLQECFGNFSTCSRDLTPELQQLALCCSPPNNCTVCSFKTCPENAGCAVDVSEAVCNCITGYEKNDDDECIDRDECSLGQQQGGHNCPPNSGCLNTEGSFECVCNLGYRLVFDTNGAMMCEDINECSEGTDSCPDNSVCQNTEGSYECNCTEDFIKDDGGECQPTCNPPCLNGGECTAPNTCTCLLGYTGSWCESDVNECQEGTHDCTHPVAECINTVGGFFCRCGNGYQGNGTDCEDVDECDMNINNCVSGSDCLNSAGSFTCVCRDGTDCTGACLRRGQIILNGQSRLEGSNSCRNCSCSNGELYCRLHGCDCRNIGIDPTLTIQCCPQCFNRDCNINGTMIRPGSMWVNGSNRCQQCRCSGSRELECVDLSKNCTQLNCPAEYQYIPPGKCCPVCILPGCNAENQGKTVTMRNGCRSCTCVNNDWRCTDRMVCPPTESCVEEQVLFYRDGCCPICERQALGLETCNRVTAGS